MLVTKINKGRCAMKINTLKLLIIPATCYFLVACSSSGGDSTPAPAIGDINGEWFIEESVFSQDAGCSGFDSYILTVAQTGNSVTVVDPNGNRFSGTISGATVSWTGSYPDGAGTTTINSLSATVAADCQSLSNGNATWSYSDPGFACSGTTTFTGTRTSGGSGTGC
jgi:hypothetical protein